MQDPTRFRLIVMLVCSIVLTAATRGMLWISEQGPSLRIQHLWLVAPVLGVLVVLMTVWIRDELGKLS